MTLTPLLDAPLAIQVHVAAALVAVISGPVALYRRRRDRAHRLTGYLWVAAMALAALSSFWITTFRLIGPFSPIHLLSVLVMASLWRGVTMIRAGRVERHAAEMRGLFWNGLLVAGLFTFLPGRVMSNVLFAGAPEAGYAVIVAGGAGLILRALRGRRAVPA